MGLQQRPVDPTYDKVLEAAGQVGRQPAGQPSGGANGQPTAEGLPAGADDARPWLPRRLEVILFALLLAVQLLPVWRFTYFPSTDGPAHVANADVLLNYFRPAGSAYHQYYEIARRPLPNLFGHAVLAALLLVAKPVVAEKILLTALLVLLPLSMRYAARAVRPDAGFLAFLAFPFAAGYFVHSGFYNFCFSLAGFFFLLGFWLRHREHLGLSQAVRLTALSLAVYSCHIFALSMACAAIALMSGWLTLEALLARLGYAPVRPDGPPGRSDLLPAASGRGPAVWAGLKSRGFVALYALLPALILSAEFSLSQKVAGRAAAPGTHSGIHSREMWADLLGLAPLVSYRSWETACAWAFAALLAGTLVYLAAARARRPIPGRWDGVVLLAAAVAFLSFRFRELDWAPRPAVRLAAYALFAGAFAALFVARVRRREPVRWDGLLLLAVAYGFLYFKFSDDVSAQLFIPKRLIVFACFALILWLASRSYGAWAKRAIAFTAGAISVAMVVIQFPAYAAYDEQLAEFVSVKDFIKPRSTLMPLIFFPRGCPLAPEQAFPGVVPFFSAAGYITADPQVHAVDLRNYEAGTDHFPVRFRPEVNPHAHLAIGRGFDYIPQHVDLAGYGPRTRGEGRVDYVVVWAAPPGMSESARAAARTWQHWPFPPPAVRQFMYPYTDTAVLFDQLDAGFERVTLPPQSQRVQLWKRKGI